MKTSNKTCREGKDLRDDDKQVFFQDRQDGKAPSIVSMCDETDQVQKSLAGSLSATPHMHSEQADAHPPRTPEPLSFLSVSENITTPSTSLFRSISSSGIDHSRSSSPFGFASRGESFQQRRSPSTVIFESDDEDDITLTPRMSPAPSRSAGPDQVSLVSPRFQRLPQRPQESLKCVPVQRGSLRFSDSPSAFKSPALSRSASCGLNFGVHNKTMIAPRTDSESWRQFQPIRPDYFHADCLRPDFDKLTISTASPPSLRCRLSPRDTKPDRPALMRSGQKKPRNCRRQPYASPPPSSLLRRSMTPNPIRNFSGPLKLEPSLKPSGGIATEPSQSSDYSYKLPCFSKSVGYSVASCETVVGLLEGRFPGLYDKIIILDCRYPFEFEGGHIANAVNVPTFPAMQKFLFSKLPPPHRAGDSSRTCIIAHCEFSKNRGPTMCEKIRNFDRELHGVKYFPRLYYPELYIMEGGFQRFYSLYGAPTVMQVGQMMPHERGLCVPCSYVSMLDSRFANEKKQARRDCGRSPSARRQSAGFPLNFMSGIESPRATRELDWDKN